MTYGYARVSHTDMNLSRQIDALKAAGIEERNILCDKASGKDFKRPAYNQLVGTEETAPRLREGDLLVVLSLDRLGRNYQEIQEQWRFITQTLKVDIKVLDMPLLDTSTPNENLESRFMADLVLQILCYVAQKEREQIRSRQAAGIASAKAQGKTLGRPKAEYPEAWPDVYNAWQHGEITATAAMQQLGLKRTTFYRLVKTSPKSEK